MKKYIIALACLTNASLFAQSFFPFWDDTTNTSWEGSLKGDLYYTDLNGTTQYWAKTTPELELMGTYSLSETFSDGDYTTGNAWTVSSGSYAVVDSVGYSGLAKSLRCATAGIISIPCNQAYGYWAFDWKKGNTDNEWLAYFINAVGTLGNTSYRIQARSSESLRFARGQSVANLFETANSYITNFTTYRDSIVRNTNGSFSVYIKGGTFGDTYTLVSVTGGSGTNPVTDNTYTQSNYFVLDLDAGDMIANIQCEYGMGSMDLNGHEMVKYPYQNSTFEGADTTYFGNNGTHSIDTSGTYKYAGSYAGKVISGALGDTTTNFTSLAYTQFGQIEAGKKYTFEYWANAASPGDWASTTKPTYTLKIGSKSFTSDTISVYPNLWEKVVYNFLATSAEVNTPIKIYCSQADTGWIDNFSIREAHDFSKWAWIKSSATGTNKMIAERFASNNGLKLSINTSNQLVAVVGDGTNAVTKTGTATTLCNGSWHLVGLTASRTGNLQLYVDGVADGTATAITSLGSIVSTTAFQIGYLSADYFNGSIGEIQRIRHTDLALMDKTPAQIYARGYNSVNMYSSYTGSTIVGWWFKTQDGVDASGNGNTVTSNGSATVSVKTGGYR